LSKQKTPTKSHFSEPEGFEEKGLGEFKTEPNQGEPELSIGGRSRSDGTLNTSSKPKFDFDAKLTPIAEDEQLEKSPTPKSKKIDSIGEVLEDEEETKKKTDLQEIEQVKAEYAGREKDEDLLSSVN
jgi:hypothetical protein